MKMNQFNPLLHCSQSKPEIFTHALYCDGKKISAYTSEVMCEISRKSLQNLYPEYKYKTVKIL